PPTITPPPPPFVPPPKIQIQPPPKAIQRVTHVKPPVKIPPSPLPPAPPSPPSNAPPSPPVPDHIAGATPINGAKVEYPEDMQEENREGVAHVLCDVEADGHTSNCHVTSVTGGHEFAEAALDFVRRARYQPAVRNGVPVREANHPYTITFRLGDE
ncbi:energy transducer TonB, partial [Tanticharoenia sakaeratensis]